MKASIVLTENPFDYEKLVSDCRAIFKENDQSIGKALLTGVFLLGSRLHQEREESLPTWEVLARDIGNASPMTLWRAWKAVEKYPILSDFLSAGIGESSIRGLFNRFFPKPPRQENELEQIQIPETIRHSLILGDFRHNTIQEDSIDLVLTDPPYGKDYLGIWPELAFHAQRVLRPGGWLLAYTGKQYLPIVLEGLSQSLTYCWLLATRFEPPFHLAHITPKINTMELWRPCVLYYKPPASDWHFQDMVTSEAPEKSIIGDWQQSEPPFRRFLEMFSKPNDTVWEPMAGSGTTLRACNSLGDRHWIAHEDNPENYEKLVTQGFG